MDTQFNDLSEPDPNIEYYFTPDERSSKFTLLMKFVLMVREHPEVIPLIEEMIKDTQTLNERNEQGWSALMIACINYNTYSNNLVVKMLIDAGADVNIVNNKNSNALRILCEYDNIGRNIEIVEMLINAGSDVHNVNKNGHTILMTVVLNECFDNITEVAGILINSGTDIDARSAMGVTVLMYACRYSSTKIIKMLIDAGANLNIKDDKGQTCLMRTIVYRFYNINHLEVIEMLIAAGADVNISSGRTNALYCTVCNILGLQCLTHAADTAKILIDAGADVNVKYLNNQTILMLLLMEGNLENYAEMIIELLYASRTTLLDKDAIGKTAYDYYVEKDHHILDEYHLQILKGYIGPNNTKSARFC